MSAQQSLRERLYIMVFQTDTVAGRRFDKILLLIILASLVTVILDSIDEVHQGYAGLLAAIEWGFTAIFLAEYITRLYCSPKPLRYAFSFYGLVDLLAIVPGIIALYYSDAQYLLIIRVIRMLRIFRVLKLSPYLKQAHYLMEALRGSKQKIMRSVTGNFSQWTRVGVEWLPGQVRYLINGRVWATVSGALVSPTIPMWLAMQIESGACQQNAQWGITPCPRAGTPPAMQMDVDWATVSAPRVI